MRRVGPIRVETVRGKFFEVYGRSLIPVARVVSARRHRGTIREAQVEGTGWSVASVKPVQVVEERDGELRVLAIRDVTGIVLRQMAIIALVVPLLAIMLVLADRWMSKRDAESLQEV